MKDIIEAAIEAGAMQLFSKNAPNYALMGNEQLTKFADIIRRDAIPEGHVLVSIETTEEMLVAGQEASAHARSQRNAIEDCTKASGVYRAW